MAIDFLQQLLEGTWITIQLAVCALFLGLVLGILFAVGKLSHSKLGQWSSHAITSLLRGLPELLVIFFIYYGGTSLLSQLSGDFIEVNAFIAGVIALALLFAAYASETLRGAYLAIDPGQAQAALAFGMSRWQCFYRIMLPQLWRYALPGLGNLWFVLLKDTALVSLIGLTDIMRTTQNITAYTHQPFTYYLIAALIYLVLTTLSMFAQNKLTRRVNRYWQGAEHGL